MSVDHHTIQLKSQEAIQKALQGIQYVANGRLGESWMCVLTRRRTELQSKRFNAICGEIAKKHPNHSGQLMDQTDYKAMFVHGLRKEAKFIPDMSGEAMIPISYSSKNLTVSEFNLLFDIIEAWCAEREITLSHHETQPEGKAA